MMNHLSRMKTFGCSDVKLASTMISHTNGSSVCIYCFKCDTLASSAADGLNQERMEDRQMCCLPIRLQITGALPLKRAIVSVQTAY